jgi:hypothetical protein
MIMISPRRLKGSLHQRDYFQTAPTGCYRSSIVAWGNAGDVKEIAGNIDLIGEARS